MEECCVCGCCMEEHEDMEFHEVKIKGENKKVCTECATAIKGLA